MQKWKLDYLLKKILNEDEGVTLVELLAAISILSIVVLLAGSVHMFGQRQFIEQSQAASQANDMNHALTVITTDLRKKESGKVDVENENEILIEANRVYYIEDNKLKKGNEVLVSNVKGQAFGKDAEGITITLETIDGIRPHKKYETKIYFRR